MHQVSEAPATKRHVFQLLLATLVVTATGGLGCGGAVGEAVRPGDKSSADALGDGKFDCTAISDSPEPLVVDWPSQDRMKLTLGMNKGVAVVHYGCDGLRLLKDCHIEGEYGFGGTQLISDVVQLETADQAAASLPLEGVKLGASLESGASIDIAIALVGQSGSSVKTATTAQLDGSCDGATHFIRSAYVGAFKVQKGTIGKVEGALDIMGAGASASSESKRKALNEDGDISDCKKHDPDADKPPKKCRSAVRLELVAIGKGGSGGDASSKKNASKSIANPCPAGYVMRGRKCAKPADDGPQLCESGDIKGCKAQCENGSAESCFNAGVAISKAHREKNKKPGPPNMKLFVESLKLGFPYKVRACDGDVAAACTSIGMSYPSVDKAASKTKQEPALKKACRLLDRTGCSQLANFYKDRRKAGLSAMYDRRACGMGHIGACRSVAHRYIAGDGVPKDVKKGIRQFELLCYGGSASDCRDVAKWLREGKTVYKKPVPRNPKRAKEIMTKACKREIVDPKDC